MTEQRKFPLVYQLDRINVANGRVNIYTGDPVDDGVDIDKLNALHACNRCEV